MLRVKEVHGKFLAHLWTLNTQGGTQKNYQMFEASLGRGEPPA